MNSEKTKQTKEFASLIRKSGFRATPTRIAVLSTLQESKKPISPQSVIDHIGKKTDQATIYRILKAYKHAGIIRQVDFRHNHPHYELSNMKDHHHFICSKCGYSEEIQGCDVETMQRAALRQAKKFTEVKEHSLEFYGVCKMCTKRA